MHTETAAEALDLIRKGGQQMVLNAHGRLAECRGHLDEGNFAAALDSAARLHDRLARLAGAQQHFGALAEAHLIRCAELEPGMKTGGGAGGGDQTVVSIAPCPCDHEGCQKLIVTFEDGHEVPMEPGWEIAILV